MNEPTINYQGYIFNGPFSINTSFNEVAGIYLITNSNGTIIDVGETENLKERIPGHERKDCWTRNSGVNLYFHHENNSDKRLEKEKFFRNKSNPACGDF